jgi:hypothetical protein
MIFDRSVPGFPAALPQTGLRVRLSSRGWTKEEIAETVQSGTRHDAVNKATGGPATEYVNPGERVIRSGRQYHRAGLVPRLRRSGDPGIDVPALPDWADVWQPALRAGRNWTGLSPELLGLPIRLGTVILAIPRA